MATRGKASGGKSRASESKGAKGGAGAKPVASDPVLGPLSRYKFGGLVTEAKPVAFLGGHSCRFVLQDFEEDPQPDEFRAAVRNALDAKPAILRAAEPHVVQYCMDALARYDDANRPALVLEKQGDVWSHVRFGEKFIVRRRTVADAEHGVYLSLTCKCDWESARGVPRHRSAVGRERGQGARRRTIIRSLRYRLRWARSEGELQGTRTGRGLAGEVQGEAQGTKIGLMVPAFCVRICSLLWPRP